MIYYMSDMHFGHKNIIDFDKRPFKTIEEHDQKIIDNWNETVGIDDEVYLLGDISWYCATKTLDMFNELNGYIHLIKGNHDTKILKNKELRNRFMEITDYKEIDDGVHHVVLSHYPIPCFNRHYYGGCHLYGHVHNTKEYELMEMVRKCMVDDGIPCNMYNVGCMLDFMDYTPRTLEEIIGFYGGTMLKERGKY